MSLTAAGSSSATAAATLVPTGDPERWLPVVGWEGLYEVSDLGRVRSVDRVEQCGASTRRRAGRVLAVRPWNGRPWVELCRDGVKQVVAMHLTVAAAWLGPRPPGGLVRHWNDDRADNTAKNLLYGTKRDNYDDAVRNGRGVKVRLEECGRGHDLHDPNLTRAGSCKACSRMRVAVRVPHGYGLLSTDKQLVSDWYFADVVAGVVLPTGGVR